MCLSHIIYHICLSSTSLLQTHKNDQLPVGLIAQLVEHCTAIAVRIPFKPGFFQAFVTAQVAFIIAKMNFKTTIYFQYRYRPWTRFKDYPHLFLLK